MKPETNPDKDNPTPGSFASELVDRSDEGKRTFKSSCHQPEHIDELTQPPALSSIIGFEEESMSHTARSSLAVLEDNDRSPEEIESWHQFKWRVSAFVNIQDIFEAPAYVHGAREGMFHLWYFYYESKFLLTESLLCGLNGFSTAAVALLRPFLEFNLLQNYFYLGVHKSAAYEQLDRYLGSDILPKWSTILGGALPKDAFCRPIRTILEAHLTGLSNSSSHPYHPDLSAKHSVGSHPDQSLEGLFSWHTAKFVLNSVLWMYLVNFPMLLHPRDTLRKFGFNPPLGLFTDEWCSFTLRKGLGEEDFIKFSEYANGRRSEELCAWYDGFPELSDEQIRATWNVAEFGELETSTRVGALLVKTKMRAMREAMALKDRDKDEQHLTGLSARLNHLSTYSGWVEERRRMSSGKKTRR